MTKEEAIELLKNRKVYVNGKSAEIQTKLFEIGFEWVTGDTKVSSTRSPFLFISDDKTFAWGNDMESFSNDEKVEISADEITSIELVPAFKENDIIVAGWEKDGYEAEWLSIVEKGHALKYKEKASWVLKSPHGIIERLQFDEWCDTQQWTRPAIKKEKQKFIDALKASSNPKAKAILQEVFKIEEKACDFKENDVVVSGWETSDKRSYKWISVFERKSNTGYYFKVFVGLEDGKIEYDGHCDSQDWSRPATDAEKEELKSVLYFSSNPKAQTILKEVFGIEERPSCSLWPFDKVLVRNGDSEEWQAAIYSHYANRNNTLFPYIASGTGWRQCIPYEGNESLRGTTKSPEEKR